MKADKSILIVEDDDIDAMTIIRAFRDIMADHPIVHMRNGEEALDYLLDDKNMLPSYILLDLNMPKMNGIEFLEARKQNEHLMKVPVVVLTTSTDDYDKIESYKNSIAGYMIKPVEYPQFVKLIQTINQYWTYSETVRK